MNDQMMNQSKMMMNQPPQVQILTQPQAPPQLMNQKSQMLSQSQLMMSQSQTQGIGQSQMMNRSYGMWPPPPHTAMEMMKFPNPMKQRGFMPSKPRNWKGKKGNDMRKEGRRKEKPGMAGSGGAAAAGGVGGGIGGGGVYKPPTLNELQYQNRLKARRFYPKKKFNNRFAPYAPRNTTSFLIRAKKSGGITSLVSPCPVTPAVLPTPIFSPSREVLGDMAKEEWGVDGYGSMKGLIRLRSPGNDMDVHDDDEEDEGGVEREGEMGDLRRRLQCLERHNQPVDEINEEVVDNVSENESEGREYVHSTEENNEEVVEENNEEGGESDLKGENNEGIPDNAGARDVHMEELVHGHHRVIAENQSIDGGVGNGCTDKSIGGGDDAVTEDVANMHGGLNAEDQSKDGVGNLRSEKSIGEGDMSNCPALM
ncbi:PRLI-interacting factor [Actinidia rufa]|uniref:PRLI-interacting factor n=1 Tax=Actinidia rufa TaxID=165716 RepID=A0A7J0GQ88_9ERIC|nr:PRLI-interacting factor [Actinidia rufa]